MARMTAAATVALLFFLPGAILTASAVDSGGLVDPEDFGALGNVTSPPDDNATRASNLTGEADLSLNETLAGGNATCGQCNQSSQEGGLNESVQGLAGPEPVEDLGSRESSMPQEPLAGEDLGEVTEFSGDDLSLDSLEHCYSCLGAILSVPLPGAVPSSDQLDSSIVPNMDSIAGKFSKSESNGNLGLNLSHLQWNRPAEAGIDELAGRSFSQELTSSLIIMDGQSSDSSVSPTDSEITPSDLSRLPLKQNDPDSYSDEPVGFLSGQVNVPDGSLPAFMPPGLVLVVGALTGTALLAANPKATLMFRRFWWLLCKSIPVFGVGLFSRLPKDKLLEQKNRELVFLAIKRNPGIQIFELVSLLDFKRSTLRHHLRILEDNNKIIQGREPPHTFLYALEDPPAPKHVLAKAPHPVDQSILRLLEEKPGITRQEIAEILGISMSQAYRRVGDLRKKGLVGGEKTGKGKVLKLHAILGHSPSS